MSTRTHIRVPLTGDPLTDENIGIDALAMATLASTGRRLDLSATPAPTTSLTPSAIGRSERFRAAARACPLPWAVDGGWFVIEEGNVQLIDSPEELAAFASAHQLRPDWHEPDERGIRARVVGTRLDNAMGPQHEPAAGQGEDFMEYNVVLSVEHDTGTVTDAAVVNLATLLSWAASTKVRA